MISLRCRHSVWHKTSRLRKCISPLKSSSLTFTWESRLHHDQNSSHNDWTYDELSRDVRDSSSFIWSDMWRRGSIAKTITHVQYWTLRIASHCECPVKSWIAILYVAFWRWSGDLDSLIRHNSRLVLWTPPHNHPEKTKIGVFIIHYGIIVVTLDWQKSGRFSYTFYNTFRTWEQTPAYL